MVRLARNNATIPCGGSLIALRCYIFICHNIFNRLEYIVVALAEWLRRVPAKYMGFPRESSNLSGDACIFGQLKCGTISTSNHKAPSVGTKKKYGRGNFHRRKPRKDQKAHPYNERKEHGCGETWSFGLRNPHSFISYHTHFLMKNIPLRSTEETKKQSFIT